MRRPCSPGFPNSENPILSGVMTHDDSERTPKNARKQAHRTTRMRPTIPRLKRAVADLTLDKLIVEEAAKGNF